MSIHRLAALCLVLLSMYGCSITPPRPSEEPAAPLPRPVESSRISVPIKVSSQSLIAEANRRLPDAQGQNGIFWMTGQPVPGFPVGNLTVQAGLNRAGSVAFSADANGLNWSVPIGINSGRFDWDVKVLFAHVRKHFDFGGSARIGGATRIKVLEDWKVDASTSLGFSWMEEPWIDVNPGFGHVKISLGGLAKPKVDEKLKDFGPTIDRLIGGVDTAAYVGEAWTALTKPIRLLDRPEVWLVVEPEKMGVAPLASEGGDLVIAPAIVGKLTATVGQPAPASAPAAPLPNSGAIGPEPGVHVALRVDAPYGSLTALAKSELVGKTITLGNQARVTITDAELYGNGRRLVAKVSFKALDVPGLLSRKKGYVYLAGRPSYDDASGILRVEDFDFHPSTNSYLVQAADWLLHDVFAGEIGKRLVFDLRPQVDPIRTQLLAGVEKKPIGDKVLLSAKATGAALSDLWVGPEALALFFKVDGAASVEVRP